MAASSPTAPLQNGHFAVNGSAGNLNGTPQTPTDAAAATSSTIKVNRLATRSGRTHAIQMASKFARPFLLKHETVPAGSPTLEPHSAILKECNVRERTVKSIKIYDINVRSDSTKEIFGTKEGSGWMPGEPQARQIARVRSKDPMNLDQSTVHTGQDIRSRDWAHQYSGTRVRRPRQIFYFCGGGFCMKPSKEHWKFCAHLALELTKKGTPTTVSIVSYPLAPHCPASIAIPMLTKLYHEIVPTPTESPRSPKVRPMEKPSCSSFVAENPEIIFAGDSSGGNIALALPMHVLATDPTATPPSSILVVSPNVEMELTNPGIPEVARRDPFLTIPALAAYHKGWYGTDMNPADPRVSPLRGDLSVFRKHGVPVNGVIGLFDILAVDTQDLVQKLEKNGVSGKWLFWDRQIHCFPFMAFYNSKEGKDGLTWIVNCLASSTSQA